MLIILMIIQLLAETTWRGRRQPELRLRLLMMLYNTFKETPGVRL